jgi:chitosanase
MIFFYWFKCKMETVIKSGTEDTPYGLSFIGMSYSQVQTVLQLTSIFENSTLDLQFHYVEDINDGRGYTFGFVGFCSGTGDGSQMLAEYLRLSGGQDTDTIKYLKAMKAIDAEGKGMNPSLRGLEGFVNYVNKNGKNKEWIQANLNIANKLYVTPSQNKAKELGLTSPLSKGQLYDSYLNHGESGAISIIKKSRSISAAGSEKLWMEKYLQNRYNILAQDRTWASSVDRVKVYQKLLAENPELNRPIKVKCYGDSYTLNPVSSPPTTKPPPVVQPPTTKPPPVVQPPPTKPPPVVQPPPTKPPPVVQPPTTKPPPVVQPPPTKPPPVVQPPPTKPPPVVQPPTTKRIMLDIVLSFVKRM